MGQIWMPVKGYEQLYMVSDAGNVMSIKNGKPYPLKPRITKAGYNRLKLYKGSATRSVFVHRLVAETFIPNHLNKPQVNHKNGIKHDNRKDNLEWMTQVENCIHAVNNGLIKKRFTKPIVQIENGAVIKEYSSTVETEKDGFISSSVRSCLIGRRKQYKGFQWKYKNVA